MTFAVRCSPGIPAEIADLTSLEVLNLFNNQIEVSGTRNHAQRRRMTYLGHFRL